jgi:RHS repeat-associated protein
VDGLGSTRILTDAQGNVLNAYDYDAFGKTINQSGTATNQYLFAGEQFDLGLGDYYLRDRFYDPGMGRFLRGDTFQGVLSSPITAHKYLYANNNPITSIDPSGFFTISETSATYSTIAILAIRTYAEFTRKGEYTPERLGGFGEGTRPPTVLDGILGWRDTWRPDPLGGFGGGAQVDIPNHTGHSTADTIDLAQYIFEAEFREPSAKSFDWFHIINNHGSQGKVALQSGKKDIFWGLTDPQIKRAVLNAWKDREKIETQDNLDTGERRIRYQGTDIESGYIIEMWYNQNTKEVETAYPKDRI